MTVTVEPDWCDTCEQEVMVTVRKTFTSAAYLVPDEYNIVCNSCGTVLT